MALRIEYMALKELVERFHPSNPKDHAVSSIAASFSTLNYREPVMLDERSGLLAAGHGRIKALVSMQQQQMDRPEGIQSDGNGAWLVPVVCGSEFTPEQLRAYLVASNNLTIEGGWNEPALAELLQELAATDTALLEAVGYDGDKLDELLRDLARRTDAGYAVDPVMQDKWGVDDENLPDLHQPKMSGHLFFERHPGKRRVIVGEQGKALNELMPQLPPPDIDYYIIAVGRGKRRIPGDVVQTFGFGNFIDFATGEFGNGCTVYLSTWSMNKDHAFMLLELLESGRIGQLHILSDPSLTERKNEIMAIMRQGMANFEGCRFLHFANHAKVYCIANEAETRFCTVTGSSNLSGLPRAENYVVSTAPELYHHYVNEFFEAMFLKGLPINGR